MEQNKNGYLEVINKIIEENYKHLDEGTLLEYKKIIEELVRLEKEKEFSDDSLKEVQKLLDSIII